MGRFARKQGVLGLSGFMLCASLPSCGEANGSRTGVAAAGSPMDAGSDAHAGSDSGGTGGAGGADDARGLGGTSTAGAAAGASEFGGATEAGSGGDAVANGGIPATSAMGGQPAAGNDSMPTAGKSVGESGNGSGDGGAASSGDNGSSLRSGTTLCLQTQECDGLECRARQRDAYGVCLSACENDSECLPDERCVSGWLDERACLHRCRLPNDCAYQFDCYDVSGARDYACLPLAWVR